MNETTCETFRLRFEPLASESEPELEAHLRSCASCSAWAECLETVIPRSPSTPLPGALRRKLRAIPTAPSEPAGIRCDDVEGLYETALARARNGIADAELTRHLETCKRCSKLYGTLEAAFQKPRRALPRRLSRRLSALARESRIPVLARDARAAVVASALLTASLMLLIGNPADVYRSAAEAVSSRTAAMAEAGAQQRQALWESFVDEIETGYERGREILLDHGRSYRELWHEARDFYRTDPWSRLVPGLTLEGERDGDP